MKVRSQTSPGQMWREELSQGKLALFRLIRLKPKDDFTSSQFRSFTLTTCHQHIFHTLGNFTDRYSFIFSTNYYQAARLLIFQSHLLPWDAGLWPGRPEGQHHPGHRGGIPPLLPLTSILRWPQVDKLKLTWLLPETQPILYRWQLILKS